MACRNAQGVTVKAEEIVQLKQEEKKEEVV